MKSNAPDNLVYMITIINDNCDKTNRYVYRYTVLKYHVACRLRNNDKNQILDFITTHER